MPPILLIASTASRSLRFCSIRCATQAEPMEQTSVKISSERRLNCNQRRLRFGGSAVGGSLCMSALSPTGQQEQQIIGPLGGVIPAAIWHSADLASLSV